MTSGLVLDELDLDLPAPCLLVRLGLVLIVVVVLEEVEHLAHMRVAGNVARAQLGEHCVADVQPMFLVEHPRRHVRRRHIRDVQQLHEHEDLCRYRAVHAVPAPRVREDAVLDDVLD